jgi:hypothetical protein
LPFCSTPPVRLRTQRVQRAAVLFNLLHRPPSADLHGRFSRRQSGEGVARPAHAGRLISAASVRSICSVFFLVAEQIDRHPAENTSRTLMRAHPGLADLPPRPRTGRRSKPPNRWSVNLAGPWRRRPASGSRRVSSCASYAPASTEFVKAALDWPNPGARCYGLRPRPISGIHVPASRIAGKITGICDKK